VYLKSVLPRGSQHVYRGTAGRRPGAGSCDWRGRQGRCARCALQTASSATQHPSEAVRLHQRVRIVALFDYSDEYHDESRW